MYIIIIIPMVLHVGETFRCIFSLILQSKVTAVIVCAGMGFPSLCACACARARACVMN